MNTFSVLLSVYEKANPRHLDDALRSIWFSQTLPPNEIVLVKDGPLSEALDGEIEKWKDALGAVLRIVRLEKHSGLGLALGIGLKACSHDIVARMDTDDISHADRFAKQINFLRHNPEVDIVGTVATEFHEVPTNITATRIVPFHHEKILQFAKGRSPLNHPSVMFKKSAILQAGNYRSFPGMEDYDLWVRMLLDGAVMANMEDPLINMRAGKSTLTRRKGCAYALNEYRLLRTFYTTGFLSVFEFVRNLLIRIPVRLLPISVLKLAYRLIRA